MLLEGTDWKWPQHGPTAQAVRAFGVRSDDLRRLPGGLGHTWTDGRLVLKPVGCVAEHTWVCEVYSAWSATEVRVPEPVMPQGADGIGWSTDRWGAHVYLTGRDVELPREMARVREASDAFHVCIKGLPRAGFVDDRDDPWAFGDRLAWEGAEPEGDEATLEMIERLRGRLTPVTSRAQMIHGDILPNVLLADGLAPAVIDWPPYHRPVEMANAIAVTDAVTFRDAPLSLLDEWSAGEQWDQLLVRALLYRLGTTGIFASRNQLTGSLATHLQFVEPVVEAVLSRW